jgi:hypothetical protein
MYICMLKYYNLLQSSEAHSRSCSQSLSTWSRIIFWSPPKDKSGFQRMAWRLKVKGRFRIRNITTHQIHRDLCWTLFSQRKMQLWDTDYSKDIRLNATEVFGKVTIPWPEKLEQPHWQIIHWIENLIENSFAAELMTKEDGIICVVFPPNGLAFSS